MTRAPAWLRPVWARALRRRKALSASRWLALATRLAAGETTQEAAPLTFSFLVVTEGAKASDVARLVKSFSRQRTGAAELLLCGPAPRRAELPPGVRIISAGAAALASGLHAVRAPFVGRLDPQGALAPHAIARLALAIAAHPGCRLVYTDEIVLDRWGRPCEAALKPAFDPVMIEGFDYVGRLALFSADLLREAGGWHEELGAAADYELVLRLAEQIAPAQALHLPYPAYLAPARAEAGGRAALLLHFERTGRSVPVEPGLAANRWRPRFDLARTAWPKVSVVVPSRDAPDLVGPLLAGLFRATDYPALDVLVVDNGSVDPRTLALYAELAASEPRFRLAMKPEPYNFARSINRGVAGTRGELVLLLNNDIEILEPGWLREMVACFDYPSVGVVGARLLYPDGSLQHAGVIAGLGGYAGHWFIGRRPEELGPMRRLAVRQSLSVVTGACMLVSRACFDAVGSFDEATFPIAYNDVDFCLRAGNAGFGVIWTPFATLTHHESASRGSDASPANIARFERDKAALAARHRTDVLEDPFFSPWYSKSDSLPFPTARSRLPSAR